MVPLVLMALAAQPEHGADTRIRVTVPREVARAAKVNAISDATAPGPILVLEDVEVGAGEGLTFSVLAPSPVPQQPPIVLAVTGVVGKSQDVPAPPLTKMQIVVPLNARANEVLAGKAAVTLTLRLKHATRGPLRVRAATLSLPGAKR